MQAHDPWNQLGFSAEAELGPQWKSFRFTFTVDQDDPDARISWTGLHPGRYDLADVSLRPGGACSAWGQHSVWKIPASLCSRRAR